MRLICPNCGAQYEVPDEVIPDSGRDVQCSNCGDTWFQYHPDHAPGDDSETEDAETEDAQARTWQAPTEDETPPEHRADPSASERPAPQPRQLDPSITEVLREEAAREQRQRSAETVSGLETQPELGLDGDGERAGNQADERARRARARMARLKGEPEDSGPQPAPEPGIDPESRRNLLPDIEEIKSSLGVTSGLRDRPDKDTDTPNTTGSAETDSRGSGFRRGFMMAVLAALLLLLLYRFAPLIAIRVPALEGVLAAYVGAVESARAALNELFAEAPGSG